MERCHFSIHLKDLNGQILYRLATDENSGNPVKIDGDGSVEITLRNPRLRSGRYFVTISARAPSHLDLVCDAATFNVEPRDVFATGKLPCQGIVYPDVEWHLN